ncbi:hypothetical protein [Yoonia sp. 2307UL14-13]|uniref:hypothetical protein n=1 Tax=Yoonia sp. 2307UL14-13 TaxID=3126506 RepID=UPI0030A08983
MRNYFIIFLVMLSSVANADVRIQCNSNGAVVTAPDGNIYYLGNGCDAARAGGGEGKWWFAASAFIVQIEGEDGIRFSREMICDVPYCLPS